MIDHINGETEGRSHVEDDHYVDRDNSRDVPTNLSNTFSSMALMVKLMGLHTCKMAIKWIETTPGAFPQIDPTP